MDSMQIYRRMDIGTAKPTRSEQKQVPHHMLDILEPEESYAVARYRGGRGAGLWGYLAAGKDSAAGGRHGSLSEKSAARHDAGTAGERPGGSGPLRSYCQRAERQESSFTPCWKRWTRETARRLHPNDLRRVVRALEIYELTGTPMSRQKRQEPERPYDLLPMALRMPRPELQTRIAQRVQEMMRQGLLREVQGLLDSGVPAESQSMQAIGYKELVPVCRGQVAEADAVWQIILNTRHYAKRQETWFRAEEAIRWADAGPSRAG